MTDQKKLKQTVRSRMQRTGESYTTAHRQVTARRGEPLFLHRPSYLVRELLAAAGVPLSEPMVCGLGGGIGFMYAVFEYASVPHPLLTIVAQHHPQPWATAVLDRLGVTYVEQHSTALAPALGKLRAALDHGPVLCTVDRSGLHEGVSELMSADPYPVLVTAAASDSVTIVDDGPPRTVAVADFGAAWSGHRKGRHHQLSVAAVPASLPLEAASRDAIATTAAHLIGPVLGNAFDVNFGFSGMAKLIEDLRATKGKAAWANRFAGSFDYAMARLVECLQREYTAPDATRPLHAAFLNDVGRADAAAEIAAAGQQWAAVTALAEASAAVAVDVRRERLDELAALVSGCLEHERLAVQLLTAR